MPGHELMLPEEKIDRAILLIRGRKVMLDADLAALYGAETRTLLQAVRRNRQRFPADFAFQLTAAEFKHLRSQSVMSSWWGGRRHRPYAFTEQGVAMLSSVLRSERAIRVNIAIMRAFVRLRTLLAAHAELGHRLDELEANTDHRFRAVYDAIRELMEPSERPRKPIGFQTEREDRARTGRLSRRVVRGPSGRLVR